jgi:hypothetical protein
MAAAVCWTLPFRVQEASGLNIGRKIHYPENLSWFSPALLAYAGTDNVKTYNRHLIILTVDTVWSDLSTRR